ncbi:MAG TPA: NUMOD3 domain-containing DNA-binding protein [Patescibacteria group bacterium]|nr:NUMOD3 domain-containing DNA-binding protein [Patescibacteria group bacterium]
MFYVVYKITNIINNKIYIGCHRTAHVDDTYMGSGRHLIAAQRKYGIQNFKKDILAVFDNHEDMSELEEILVNKDFVKHPFTYNLIEGGYKNIATINEFKLNLYGKNGQKGYGQENLVCGNKLKTLLIASGRWEKYKDKISKSHTGKHKGTKNAFYGKKHTQETKNIIGRKNSIKQAGQLNSRYGTVWIYCPYTHESRSINKEELNTLENLGWVRGRKIK